MSNSRTAAAEVPRVEPIQGYDGATLDINYFLTEEYAEVSGAAKELPAVMEWLNELRSAYAEERDLAKGDLDRAEATAYFDLRGTGDGGYQANYGTKPTEDGLKMAIELDKDVRILKDKVARLSAVHGRLTGTIMALQAKVDLLRSSEATRRSAFNETSR